MSGNATGLDSEITEELKGGSIEIESVTGKLWEREFGKGDMSLRLGRVIPEVHKGKGVVQWPNGSEWKNQKENRGRLSKKQSLAKETWGIRNKESIGDSGGSH